MSYIVWAANDSLRDWLRSDQRHFLLAMAWSFYQLGACIRMKAKKSIFMVICEQADKVILSFYFLFRPTGCCDLKFSWGEVKATNYKTFVSRVTMSRSE